MSNPYWPTATGSSRFVSAPQEPKKRFWGQKRRLGLEQGGRCQEAVSAPRFGSHEAIPASWLRIGMASIALKARVIRSGRGREKEATAVMVLVF